MRVRVHVRVRVRVCVCVCVCMCMRTVVHVQSKLGIHGQELRMGSNMERPFVYV